MFTARSRVRGPVRGPISTGTVGAELRRTGLEAEARQEKVEPGSELVGVAVVGELVDDVVDEGELVGFEFAPLLGGAFEEGLPTHAALNDFFGWLQIGRAHV